MKRYGYILIVAAFTANAYAGDFTASDKAFLDIFYLQKEMVFGGDVTGTATNMVVTNVTGINFEEKFEEWEYDYGSNVVLFYQSISNAYYGRRILSVTNSPRDGQVVAWNAYDLTWYSTDAGSDTTVQQVNEAGAVLNVYDDVSVIQFDIDSGLYVTSPVDGTVKVYVGSHWYGIGAGGETNAPTGSQNIQFNTSTNVTGIEWDTNTTPWTLTWESPSSGATGARGYPGYSFVYMGAYDCDPGITYTTNWGANYGGGYYGCIATNWTAPDCVTGPPDYPLAWIELATPGANGSDGYNGSSYPYLGAWLSTYNYPTGIVVRGSNGVYSSELASSNKIPQPDAYWDVYLLDGADGADGIAGVYLTNAFFATGTTYEINYNYTTNQAVSSGGSLYLCVSNNGPGNQHYPTETDYWTKIVDKGENGINGINGTDGIDGVGDMMFDDSWQYLKNYTNVPVMVLYNGQTFASTQGVGNLNKNPVLYTNIWKLAAQRGADGGNWVFDIGWDMGYPYSVTNVVISSNIFYHSIQNANTGNEPWNTLGTWWEIMISPEYREYLLVNSLEWVPPMTVTNGQLVRYDDSTWESVADGVSTDPSDVNTNWVIFARKGATGSTGPAGEDGTTTIVYTNSSTYYETNFYDTTYMTNFYTTTNYYTTDWNTVTFTNMSTASNLVTLEAGVLNINFKTNYTGGNLEWNAIFTNMKFVCDFMRCGSRRHKIEQVAQASDWPLIIGELRE